MTSSYAQAEVVAPAETAPVALAVCVFCGSQHGHRPAAATAARELGKLLGSRGHSLVYGAGGSGLMGEVARSAHSHGSAVTGYAPHFIYERERDTDAPKQTMYLTKDLFERKRRMLAHGDVFVALPGGYGTLDEILDVLSLRYLDIGDKPLILLNTDGFWGDLARLADALYDSGFAGRSAEEMFQLAATPLEAVELAERLAIVRPVERTEFLS
jgi:uncharacterized protein (TIGR00730 family)